MYKVLIQHAQFQDKVMQALIFIYSVACLHWGNGYPGIHLDTSHLHFFILHAFLLMYFGGVIPYQILVKYTGIEGCTFRVSLHCSDASTWNKVPSLGTKISS